MNEFSEKSDTLVIDIVPLLYEKVLPLNRLPVGRLWEDLGKTLGRPYKDFRKTLGRPLEDFGKHVAVAWGGDLRGSGGGFGKVVQGGGRLMVLRGARGIVGPLGNRK